MSDKSFGDHMSRGIVKNPLLSTAVTGLSIEDLTHNAVLLPVSRTAEPIGRQEPEPITLAHEITPSPSGDATFTPIHPPTEQNAKKDDFDVNEYFARLQGTRYVSAPINSHIEDSLDKEENLEEINLNEPIENIQQTPSGITADIAQNFSQLPTVLPQVASAVFSSFSNMLSMKSREHTPEAVKTEQAQVPLMGVSEREVAPPPREPPVSGPANFRLTTKKKYAQIPGLSSGEPKQMPYSQPTFNQPIFTPQQEFNCYTNVETNIPTLDVGQTNVNFNVFDNVQSIPVETRDNQTNVFEASKQEGSNFVATSQCSQETNAQAIIPPPPMFSNLAKRDNLPNVGKTILPPSVARRIGSNKPTISNQAPSFAAVGNIFVPSPVDQFSTNAPQFAPPYQTNPTLATSFPTNYASRVPSQPLSMPIPPNTAPSALPPNATLTSSDIIPSSTSQIGSSITMPTNTSDASAFNAGNQPPPPRNVFATPPAMTSYATSSSITSSVQSTAPEQLFTPRSHSQPVAPPPMFPGSSISVNTPQPTNVPLFTNVESPTMTSMPAPLAIKSESRMAPNMSPPTNVPLFTNVASVPTTSTSAPPMFAENPRATNIPPPTNIPLYTNVSPTPASVITAPPQMRTLYLQDQPTFQSERSAQISQPTVAQISKPPKDVSLLSQNLTDDQIAQATGIPPVAEHPKIPEPPKASGSTSFRMTKKRPQYYSGPIEGVGAISNNVKPTLTPLAPAAFQGAVLTPESTENQAVMITPDVTENVTHGAILTAENITGNQKQYSMFTPIGVDVNTPASQYPSESTFATHNTSFDLSRQATDSYEPPKQESAFGIIGSLKSKLSSIGIDKLQNSVTTFFDPGYNVKTETAEINQPNYEQNQGIEIFVPNPDAHPQPYNYDAHQTSFTYGQGSIPNASDYYNQQTHNMYSNNSFYTQPSYGTENYSHTDIPVQQPYHQDSNIYYNPTPAVKTESSHDNVVSFEFTSTEMKDNGVENETGNNVGFSQELAASFGTPAMKTEFSQANTVPCESTSTGATENKTGNNFAVNQELTKSSGTVPVDFGKTDGGVALPQDQFVKNVPETKDEENVTEAVKNLQIKDDVKENFQPFQLTEEFIKLNYISSPYASQFGEFSEALFRGTGFIDMQDRTKENEEHMREDKAQIDRIYSSPLRDLSSMIADRSKDISDGVSEGGVSWDSNEEEVDDCSAAERLMALASDDDEAPPEYEIGHPDLSTCGTCGGINRPEQDDSDLTHQLINNINAPIQLSNPVEVPLTESHSSTPDNFDPINQCAEISFIADETIETLQIQSATELLNDNEDKNTDTSYGWRAEAPLPLGQDLLDHDYSFKPNPNAIGFSGNNKLFFDNVPDYSSEMKPELTLPQDEIPIVLQREMSIPTAPPAEDSDDAKSDETGVLDVQSIEQDASKDFPVFEEYVIEPCEMDDEKIEFSDKIDETKDTTVKSNEVKDTFTNRVDRFKKLEGNEDATEHKDSSASHPNTMMPSYFDTGNYAAEAHFKNSMTSPTIARIPPGFEDYELMSKDLDKKYEPVKVPDTTTQTKHTTSISVAQHLNKKYEPVTVPDTTTQTKHTTTISVAHDLNKKYEPVKVPDTTTQTKDTTSISVAHTKTENLTSTVFSNMSAFTNEPTRILEQQAEPKLFDLANIFGSNAELDNTILKQPQPETKLPEFASVFGAKIESKDTIVPCAEKNAEVPTKVPTVNPQANVEDKVLDIKLVTLPDPINFFGSSTQEPDATEGVNRLASYFSTPAKPDNTKSFFELSQGQDHYRQEYDKSKKDILSESQNYKENFSNIPLDRYVANLNLMKDLTSCQNIDPTKDQIVRTVNYFTVEYDNGSLNFNKGEPSLNLKADILNKDDPEKEEAINDTDFTDVVNKCKYCRDLAGPVLICEVFNKHNVKFRQAMDSVETSSPKEVNLEQGREGERSVNLRMEDLASDGDNSEGVAMLTENRSANEYEPVKHHWFYRVDCEDKSSWRGFSNSDSRAIEDAFHSPTLHEGTLVPTDGGRYDVNVVGRLRIAVYWSDKPTNVRRCSWFYKGTTDARYVPYTEAVAEKLEVEYRHGVTTGEWHRRLLLPNNELVVMHGPAVMVHFLQGGTTDAFSAPNLFTFGKRVYRNPPKFKVPPDLPPRIDHLLLLVHGAGEWKHQRDKIQSTTRPRVVRRGIDESEIEDTEPSSIDHLLLLCHGVGSACDMRFRAVEEVVDDFRATSLQLLQSHYRNSYDNGIVGRVEVLPISWHASLHSGPKGVDRRLACVTLASIPRLRSFTNDTVLDVLFYTSPHYCQMILDTVCGELNRIYTLFRTRNPDFKGQVSLGGHSLGSVILYDLLCNQPIPRNPVKVRSDKTYISGTAANNPTMQYPTLCFEPLALYALGSPIAIFECIRGVESLGSDFYLPTCRNFFNIFHPYDPIAYRIEPLVNPQLQNVKPSLIPHHKGRKRMHLELKDTMARVGADLKQKLIESIRNTWTSMWSSAAPPDHQLEKVVEEEIEKEQLEEESLKEEPIQADVTPGDMLGRLNDGRRVDYVLQEAPFEMINEYLFAMSSHVCYWESEDVMLLILREIYDSMGVQPDVTVPQNSMTVHRTTIVSGNERIVTNAADASTSQVS